MFREAYTVEFCFTCGAPIDPKEPHPRHSADLISRAAIRSRMVGERGSIRRFKAEEKAR